MNTVQIIGRLTKDIELRNTTNNLAVTRFSIAVMRDFVKQGEERQTDFINCVAFGKTAEFLEKYFKKGSQLVIIGRIQTGSYEKEGKKVYTTDILVEKVYFAGNNVKKVQEKQKNIFGIADETDLNDLPF